MQGSGIGGQGLRVAFRPLIYDFCFLSSDF